MGKQAPVQSFELSEPVESVDVFQSGLESVAANGNKVSILDTRTGKVRVSSQVHLKPITGLQLIKSGQRVVSASSDHFVKVSDPFDDLKVTFQEKHPQPIMALGVSANMRAFAFGYK